MSSDLTWAPVVRHPANIFPDSVKFAMRKKYGDPVDATLGRNDITYLEGLRDAGVKDVQSVIDAISEFGEISVKEVY